MNRKYVSYDKTKNMGAHENKTAHNEFHLKTV